MQCPIPTRFFRSVSIPFALPAALIATASLVACGGGSSTPAEPDDGGDLEPGASTSALIWGEGEWGSENWNDRITD